MSDTKTHNGGLGFCSILALIFITLKLTGYIDWSWWWVLAPIWIPICLGLSIIFVVILIAGIAALISRLL